MLEIAEVRGLALVQMEERHSSATNQVRVEDNKHRVGNDGQVVTIHGLDGTGLMRQVCCNEVGLAGYP